MRFTSFHREEIPDALSLEYKREYGCASGQIKLSDVLNYAPIASEFRRFGLSLSEKSIDFLLRDTSALGNDVSDPSLIRANSV